MSRDTPEIRLKSHRKVCKLCIFIAPNVTPSNSLYRTTVDIYQHVISTQHGPNKNGSGRYEMHVFIPVGQAPSTKLLSSNSLCDTIYNVSKICNYYTKQYYTKHSRRTHPHSLRFTLKSQQTKTVNYK